MTRHWMRSALLLLPLLLVGTAGIGAQSVTTSALAGEVRNEAGTPVAGASVQVVHEPSGTRYTAATRADGRFAIPGMRVGGPYTVTISYLGYSPHTTRDVNLTLGTMAAVNVDLAPAAVQLAGIEVSAQAEGIMNADRTGAFSLMTREQIDALPTIAGRLESVVRLSAQSNGRFSFAGQDSRMNTITVDGTLFNNSFGLANTPGDRTGVAPISLQALEQVQVAVAPFDVRNGSFVGAGVNSVTRSGTNMMTGSLYYQMRDESFVGKQAGETEFDPGTFNYRQFGAWLGGPIIRDRLFYFVNFERDGIEQPGTTFRANTGTETPEGNTTRVRASDLDTLADYLRTNFSYDPGGYQGYSHETPSTRFLAKLDYNFDERNKLTLRYNFLDSSTDILASNSSSLGWGSRRSSTQSLNFQNTNYKQFEEIRSVAAEWNSLIGGRMANNLLVGYSSHDESRGARGDFFPMVDILDGSTVYTTFGFEPFTPNNELRYTNLQLQNHFSYFAGDHTVSLGVAANLFESENVFYPGSQSVYVYNSLADFYADANGYLANPNRTTGSTSVRRFQVRWANIPGMEKPTQPLQLSTIGIYGQDEWEVTPTFRLTAGVRVDIPAFSNEPEENPLVPGLSFRDADGNTVTYSTSKLADTNPLFSPRVGFNWDMDGERGLQLRGGTGVFSGPPPLVWISNQVGANGMLTGFERLENTTTRPFHPDPNHYKPEDVTGNPASQYELAITDPEYRFPQLWRTNLAADFRIPMGWVATAEGVYSKDLNATSYINANLAAPNTAFNGVDSRPRWTTGNRINSNIDNAIVLQNQNESSSWHVALTLERPFRNGMFGKIGYSYGESKNTVDAGSVAFGSWNNNQHTGDPNNPGLGYSSSSSRHRIFGAASYRAQYFDFGATTLTLFGEGRTPGNASYTFAGDLNGDGGTSNDLIYIPRDLSEMNFQQYTTGSGTSARTFTAAEQAEAWDAFIEQDPYLSGNRGRYAERGGIFLPMFYQFDLSVIQEIFSNFGGYRNSLQLRADILNVGNLLSESWGVGERFVTTQPLLVPSSAQGGAADSQGRAQYRLREVGGNLISKTFEPTAGLGDVYQIQIGLRYMFQ